MDGKHLHKVDMDMEDRGVQVKGRVIPHKQTLLTHNILGLVGNRDDSISVGGNVCFFSG